MQFLFEKMRYWFETFCVVGDIGNAKHIERFFFCRINILGEKVIFCRWGRLKALDFSKILLIYSILNVSGPCFKIWKDYLSGCSKAFQNFNIVQYLIYLGGDMRWRGIDEFSSFKMKFQTFSRLFPDFAIQIQDRIMFCTRPKIT